MAAISGNFAAGQTNEEVPITTMTAHANAASSACCQAASGNASPNQTTPGREYTHYNSCNRGWFQTSIPHPQLECLVEIHKVWHKQNTWDDEGFSASE